MKIATLLPRLIALDALLGEAIELGIKARTLRSGKQVVVETLNRPGAFVGHFPKSIEVHDPKSESFVRVTKKTAREADVDMVQTPTAAHGTPRNAGTIKGFMPLFRNLKKNRVAVEYDPAALSRSRRRGAVTSDAELNRGYVKMGKRLGFTYRRAGAIHRLEP